MAKLFIVGVGRSGTSLLQSMFASHSSVGFLPETGFVRRYLRSGKLAKTFKRLGYSGVINILEKDEKISRLNLDLEATLDSALSMEGHLDFNFFDCILKNIEKNCEWVGDKDPRLIEDLDMLYYLYGNAYVINITRDPRDVLASRKKSKWAEGYIWKHMLAIRVQYVAGVKFSNANKTSRFFTVSYERLIEDPAAELTKLCSLIGMKYEDDMLDFGQAAKRLVSKSEMDWKKETLGPLIRNNSGKWREELPLREAALVEMCSKDFFTQPEHLSDNCFARLQLMDQLWVFSNWIVVQLSSLIITKLKSLSKF